MAANDGDEAIVSLVDVLEEDEELENEASAVLAGSDAERCSYPEGYVKRQALYACSTCTPKGGEPAGICLACSYKCHEGHELYELYTKRNFRCDCGNSKFGDKECKLFPDKDRVNSDNLYSHNFFGLYCTCNRPYPDVEDQVADEMIQCVVCEDWLHGRHLGCDAPESIELQEMVCESCMKKAPFLWTYAAHIAIPPVAKDGSCKSDVVLKKEEADEAQDKSQGEKAPGSPKGGKASGSPKGGKASGSPKGEKVKENGLGSCKRKRSESESGPSKDVGCSLKELQAEGRSRDKEGAVFWPTGWRSRLCSCSSCTRMFERAEVTFLLDEADTVLAYETKGKSTEQEQQSTSGGQDPLMSAFNTLNRVQQLEIIYEYNDLKTELRDYLQRFAAEGKVVTPDDIRQFFEEQQTRKRRRANNTGQYYCG